MNSDLSFVLNGHLEVKPEANHAELDNVIEGFFACFLFAIILLGKKSKQWPNWIILFTGGPSDKLALGGR